MEALPDGARPDQPFDGVGEFFPLRWPGFQRDDRTDANLTRVARAESVGKPVAPGSDDHAAGRVADPARTFRKRPLCRAARFDRPATVTQRLPLVGDFSQGPTIAPRALAEQAPTLRQGGWDYQFVAGKGEPDEVARRSWGAAEQQGEKPLRRPSDRRSPLAAGSRASA